MPFILRKPKHTIYAFAIFLVSMALMLLVSQVVTTRYIDRSRNLVSLMNEARQQAVYTEQIKSAGLRDSLLSASSFENYPLWDSLHHKLVDRERIPFAEFNFVRDRSRLVGYYEDLEAYQERTSISTKAWAELLDGYSDLMVKYANQVEAMVQSKADSLQHMKFFFTLLVLSAIIAQVFFIFYPAYLREKETKRQLEQVNLDLQLNVEEMQSREEELSQNLEEMTALQDQLASSESRYRNLVESSQDIIYELSDSGGFSYINPTFTRLLGYTGEEAYNTGYWEYIQEGFREEAVQFYFNQIKNQEAHSYLEVPIISKSGDLVWLGQNVQIEYNGDWVQRVFAIARDITQLKLVQQQLSESEHQYRLLSENSRDVVSLYNPDGRVTYISSSVKEMLGYEPEEIVDTLFQRIIHPEDLDILRKEHAGNPEALRKVRTNTYRVKRADGKYVWLESITKPFFDAEGNLEYIQSASRDVTLRREVEEQLRHQKEMLSEAQVIAKMASWEFDRASRKFFVSESIHAILPGLDSKDGILLEEYQKFIHPDDMEMQSKAFNAALQEGISYQTEVRHILPEGQMVALSFRAQPLTDSSGKVRRVVGSLQDITEARRQRDLLQKRQDELVAFINAAPAAMAMFDKNFRYITASHRWLDDFGLEDTPVAGKGHYDLLPKWNPVWRNYQDLCLAEGESNKPKRPFKTFIQGQEEWVRWECRPWHDVDGQAGGIILYAELITEKLNEEREQQVQQLRMQTIYRVVSKVSGDLEEQITDVLSIATEELGMRVGMITQIDQAQDLYTIREVYAPGEDIHRGDSHAFYDTVYAITYEVDSIVAIDPSTEPLFGDALERAGVVGQNYIGVTLYMQGERYGTLSFSSPDPLNKPFRQIDKDYVQLVGQWVAAALERARFEREIIDAKESAEAATEAKAQFLSMMSHEIRTPLNAVIGMTHLLLQENPREDQLENLKTLRFSGENLLVLINDILDFSKIEAGKITLENVPFSLKEIGHGIHNSLGYKAKEKGIDFELHLDPNLPEQFMGDPVRISQILTNLSGNAVKFAEKGKVTLAIRVVERSDKETELRFEVSDTGIGIPEEKRASIFESFTQARSDTTRKYGGTGLGLAITKRLLELMESDIHLESKESQGSTFSFPLTLPIATGQSPTKLDVDVLDESVRGSLKAVKLLLVEDNPVNQLVATKFLKRWKIESDIANNGKEAVEMIKSMTYHVVLMDLQMPEMDGYEASRTIRSMESGYFQEVPIIALTASAMQDVRNKVMAAGMTDFVTKPFNPVELYRKIVQYAQENTSVAE